MNPWVLGINGSHNGSYCLLQGDRVHVAVQEERLLGLKRARVSGARPALALRYCLDAAGIDVGDLAMIVISSQGPAGAVENDVTLNPDFRAVRHVPVRVVPHHLAHAASALATSGFDRAAVLVVDGLGSPVADSGPSAGGHVLGPADDGWEHASLFVAHGAKIRLVHVHTVAGGRWLHKHADGMWGYSSLGGMFSAIAQQVFGDETAAGEVMGLAAYGEPTIPATEFVDFEADALVFPNLVQRRFPFTERWPAHEEAYAVLAASGQAALEGAVVRLANRLRELTGEERLCYAGGVALNSVANEAIRRAAGFRDVHVVPAAEDSGVALGAAYLGCWELTGRRCGPAIRTDAHGATYPAAATERAITRVPATVAHTPDDLLDEVAGRLVRGEIGAWYQGGSELGPRALGHRSIVCSPIGPDVKAILNARVKFRQMFRPFAPAVLREEADHWFDFDGTPNDSPFMLRVVPFRPDRRDLVPAVVHRDGTGRLQTLTREDDGSFYDLVARFGQRTGVPILLNTSLNVRGEPIAERPEDALWCLLGTGLDFCVLDDRLVTKLDSFGSILDLVPTVVAEACTVALSIGDGAVAFRPDGERGVVLRTATPWGPADVPLSSRLFVLLSNIDGRRSGHELRGSLSGAPPAEDVARDLLLLRRMGAIALTPGGVAVIDAVDRLAAAIDRRWSQARYARDRFAPIAFEALSQPLDLDFTSLVEAVLTSGRPLPRQRRLDNAFGQPAITLHHDENFAVDALCWLVGLPGIHEHAFCGAFRVVTGHSFHTRYAFRPRRCIDDRLVLGALELQRWELLGPGATVPIVEGPAFIHAAFHTDTPSMTIVVRTHDSGAPEHTYLPPGLGFDPAARSDDLHKRLQLLDTLAQVDPERHLAHVEQTVAGDDLYAALLTMVRATGQGLAFAPFTALVDGLVARHGPDLQPCREALLESWRRERLAAMRRTRTSPDDRYLLACLLSLPSRSALLDAVAHRWGTEGANRALGAAATWLLDVDPRAEGVVVAAIAAIVEDVPPAAFAARLGSFPPSVVGDDRSELEAFYAELRGHPLLAPLRA